MEIKTVKKVNDINPQDQSIILAAYNVTYNDTPMVNCVPLDEENTDYQEILKWVAEGNTIEEAD